MAKRGREGEGTGGRARRRLGGRLGAGAGFSSLVLLDKNGCRKVSMKGGGEGAASGKLEPYSFPSLSRKKVNQRVIWPPGVDGVGDVLKCTCHVILYSIGRLYCDCSVPESGLCLIMYVPIGSIALDYSKRPLNNESIRFARAT